MHQPTKYIIKTSPNGTTISNSARVDHDSHVVLSSRDIQRIAEAVVALMADGARDSVDDGHDQRAQRSNTSPSA